MAKTIEAERARLVTLLAQLQSKRFVIGDYYPDVDLCSISSEKQDVLLQRLISDVKSRELPVNGLVLRERRKEIAS